MPFVGFLLHGIKLWAEAPQHKFNHVVNMAILVSLGSLGGGLDPPVA